jgi:2-polyprenyl-6-methoxyphenol hydroxylase-like FAD-dependent oxidoreductase
MVRCPIHERDDAPAVLIVGGGLGGLLLGILLETIKIPYHIFERATEVRPPGM